MPTHLGRNFDTSQLKQEVLKDEAFRRISSLESASRAPTHAIQHHVMSKIQDMENILAEKQSQAKIKSSEPAPASREEYIATKSRLVLLQNQLKSQ